MGEDIMVYIYDILVNFNDSYLLDFFEWNMNDSIENLKKVRLYHISTNCMDELIENKVCVSNYFLEEIFKTCEVYTKIVLRLFHMYVYFLMGFESLRLNLTLRVSVKRKVS